ncbi:hypothetical protein V6U89_22255 [Micromonospora sp. CPCC 206171]|uniref:hypothetical protein n=1 Tax=Micromonospora sp. CPCC 206171 TaxID=3122405 RepID=UPI002FEEF4A2
MPDAAPEPYLRSTDPEIMPWWLTWPEVDPARHSFDRPSVPDVVRLLAPAASVPTRPPGRSGRDDVYEWGRRVGTRWADEMSVALVRHYGRWVSGWRWGVGEADLGGGPVHAWCCPADSMGSPEQTLDVVTEALVEWRGWLEELAERFGRFLPAVTDDRADVALDGWERAVAHLVTVVVDRTCADGGWEHHCRQVLGWFLTVAGVPAERHAPLVEHAIGGRFDSFVAPPDRLIREVAERFAGEVERRAR